MSYNTIHCGMSVQMLPIPIYIPLNYNCEMVCYFGSQESVFLVSHELALSNEWISCDISCSLHLWNSIDKSYENWFHKSGHAFNSIQLNSIQFKGALIPEQEAPRERRPPHSIRFFLNHREIHLCQKINCKYELKEALYVLLPALSYLVTFHPPHCCTIFRSRIELKF